MGQFSVLQRGLGTTRQDEDPSLEQTDLQTVLLSVQDNVGKKKKGRRADICTANLYNVCTNHQRQAESKDKTKNKPLQKVH